MKKIVDAQTTFDSRLNDLKSDNSKKKKRNDIKMTKNLKMMSRRINAISTSTTKSVSATIISISSVTFVKRWIIFFSIVSISKKQRWMLYQINSMNRKDRKKRNLQWRLINRWRRRISEFWDQQTTCALCDNERDTVDLTTLNRQFFACAKIDEKHICFDRLRKYYFDR